jgi:hypothetical protein
MNKGEICLALNISEDKWDHYWEGTLYFHNQNIGTFTRQVISPMIGFGITKDLNLFAELPYVSTFASGGQMNGDQGIQDFNIGLKYHLVDLNSPSINFRGLLSANYTHPASNYLSDYLPFSLGLGAQSMSLRTILFASALEERIFARGNFSYSHVGNTEIERFFYYADGAYYSNIMDVPSRYGYEVTLGSRLFNKKLHLEAGIANQTSLTGDDIRRYNAPQPTNKMDMTNLNARIRIFPVPSSSIILGYTQVINGRNVGKSTIYSLMLTHQFGLFKTKKESSI